MDEKKIEFLIFTVKQNADSIVDVTVDIEDREYRIEQTDLYGHLLAPETGGKLRRSKVDAFQEKLAELNVTAWPLNEMDTQPLNLENASLIYIINEKDYYTTGVNTENLIELHKTIEQVVGTTFGSYEFYN